MTEVQDQEEMLWELYVAECARTSTKPDLSDFLVWKSEKGYEDDLTDSVITGDML